MALSKLFKAHANELEIPPDAKTDSDAREILRVWIVRGGAHVSLHDAFPDVGAWGLLLADVARHVVNAQEQQHGRDRAATLARIRELFDAEFQHPTDEPTGKIVG